MPLFIGAAIQGIYDLPVKPKSNKQDGQANKNAKSCAVLRDTDSSYIALELAPRGTGLVHKSAFLLAPGALPVIESHADVLVDRRDRVV